ncbi:TPM domain-containing protein [Anaerocolumna xylanovorans]|uniref:TPM domain-containing protein n=1 Tax=Anaerocolumna xylanovorans DSM 12503 TaxID=1121345 RepID=A0A1M7Y747_9FIRM|nr:TPM domain-containing protein [Anaerocolumna xylanovorans]SHO48477.1 uncharacterized protein SAMN02745217_01867 [Anaerocolumna xylanovorans DSM 12503]
MKTVYRKSALSAFILFFAVLAGLFFFGRYPLSVNASAEDDKQYVYDNYGLFSEEDVNELTDACLKYREEAQADIIMITSNNLGGKAAIDYLEDFYDEKGFGYDEKFGSTVMMLVYIGEDRRNVTIHGYGKAEYYVNNDRIEHILDDLSPFLKEKKYKKAFVEFAKESAYYMNESEGVKEAPASNDPDSGNYYGESSYDGPSNYYGEEKESPFYNTLVQLGIALVIGAVSVAVMAFNSGGRMTVQGKDYMDGSNSGILESSDDYLRTTTTRVKKPTPQSDDGPRSSGGGGVSSGGHSHSGGSRDF